MNKTALNALRKRLLTRLRTGRVGEQILEFLLPNKEFGKNFTIGHITTVPGTSAATVVGSGLTPEFQNLGLGKKLYGEMIRRSPGQVLLSDGNVSPSATRVWEGMIRRRPALTQLNPGWKWDPKLETFVQESGPQYSRTSPTFSATLPSKAAIKQSAVIERSGDPGLYLRLHREVSVSHLNTAYKLGAAQAQHDFQAEFNKMAQPPATGASTFFSGAKPAPPTALRPAAGSVGGGEVPNTPGLGMGISRSPQSLRMERGLGMTVSRSPASRNAELQAGINQLPPDVVQRSTGSAPMTGVNAGKLPAPSVDLGNRQPSGVAFGGSAPGAGRVAGTPLKRPSWA